MHNSVLLFLTSFLFYANTFAQNFPVKYLDISSGLSNNSVTSVYQDSSGYLWFGTFNGLNRYDGYDFKVFLNKINDSTSLKNNYVYCIEGDAKNNIWVGGSNGACVLDQSRSIFTSLRYTINKQGDSRLLKEATHKILHIKGKNLTLVATQNYGLVTFKDGSYTGEQVVAGKQINNLNYNATVLAYVPEKGFCYVFADNIGLCKYVLQSGRMEVLNRQLPEANCFELCAEGLFIGTDDGLYLYNEKLNTVSKSYLPEKRLVKDLMAENGDLWIATDGGGVFMLKKNTAVAVPYNYTGTTPLLKSNSVWSLFKDNKGERWFGTLRGGISMMGSSPLYFNHYRYKDANNSPTDNFILSFCEDEKQNIWIGTDGGGLRYWDRKKNTYTNYTATAGSGRKIPSNFVTSIVKDPSGAVWISMWGGGISRIDNRNNTIQNFVCYNAFTQKQERDTWILFIDSKKNLWAGTSGGGTLYIFDKKSNKFVVFNKEIKDVNCLYETTDGKIWGGNLTSVIAIDPHTGKHEQYRIDYTVRCVLEDKAKNLWVGTSEGGLILFNRKTGSYKRFTKDDGLPGNTILRLLEDKNGNLWMSTYNGVSRFDPRKKIFRNFSVSDGLQSNEFNFNAGMALSSGEFILGGINGFNLFNPEHVKDYKQSGKILLNDLFVDNKPVEKSSPYITGQTFGALTGVSLPFDKSTLSIDFVSLDFVHSDKTNYAYLLDGWDTEWNYTGKNRKANYSRLHEGTYVFKVKTTNNYGKWGTATTLLTIKVLPPWYRAWWAYAFYFLALAGIVYGYLRYSTYKQKLKYEVKLAHMESKKEKELSEKQLSMFTFIAHELRTPLSLIINPLKLAVNPKNGEDNKDIDFNIAYRNARRLLSLTDQLLLFRKAESDADELKLSAINLNALCDEVYQCFVYQAKEQKIMYNFFSPDTKIELLGDYEKIEIALFNLVSNAFKYTFPGGTITISLKEAPSEACIEVSDTGRGIEASEIDSIFEKFKQVNSRTSNSKGFGIGLFVTRYFITKHLGRVSCSSVLGKGSTFTVTLPKGYDHFADMPVSSVNLKMSELVEELLAGTPSAAESSGGIVSLQIADKEQDAGVSSKKVMLIIEDNTDIRNYLIQLFTKTYIVYSAADGLEGFKLTQKHMPDIVLSDITMEGMDGLELCKKIKQDDELSHIPVILLTATTNPDIHLQGITEGADDYITKPFDSDILQARVEALLRNRGQLRKYFLDSITLNESNHKVPLEYKEFLDRCIEIVEANLENKDFTLKSFSAAMGMSHSSLYKKIKAISGQTVTAFIRSIRLRRAAVILLTETANIAQAGSQVGLDDPRYFREQFVKLFGMTPSEYIKRYRNSFNKELNIIQK